MKGKQLSQRMSLVFNGCRIFVFPIETWPAKTEPLFHSLQDMIDNAIIGLQSGKSPEDGVYLQQFPYPCFKRDNYLSGIYTAQLLQVVLGVGAMEIATVQSWALSVFFFQ